MNIISIQVLPCYEDDDCAIAQFEGPDDNTQFWTIYTRNVDGTVGAIYDFTTRFDAVAYAQGIAGDLGVPVESYPWLTELA